MADVKNIRLTAEELERCIEFARTSAPTQQAIEFGQDTTQARSVGETARDTLIGKIAEAAFRRMMSENYGIDVPLDFNYYPQGQWDDQDAEVNGWRIDVKGTREGGRWMLIEWNKLNFRQKQRKLSHLYVMFTVGWDREMDQPTGTARYQGFVTLSRLRKDSPHTRVLPKGTSIPGTRMILQADNFGIPFTDLYNYPQDFADILTIAPPHQQLVDRFPNPYTGETAPQG